MNNNLPAGNGKSKYRKLLVILLNLLAVVLFFEAESGHCQKTDEGIDPSEFTGFSIVRPGEIAPLDQPIDPLSYMVGPGDKLRIFIWGSIQAQYDITVTPEGKLLVPTVGPIDISGMILSSAKIKIEQEILERFRNVQVTADLIGLRTFKVAIGGAVNYAGVYTANAVTRVSEIIKMAGGFQGENKSPYEIKSFYKPVTFPSGIASQRNIIINSVSGSVDTADILLFEQTGDMKYNYKLSDGDEIFVPLREQNINMYGVFGGVRNPAYFEYSARDSLTDLIKLGHGLSIDADSSYAELVRFAPDGTTEKHEMYNLREILHGEEPDIQMQPDDRLFIKTKKDFNEKHQVLILGEVRYPGFYAIKPESTYLSEILTEAGGFTELASLAEAEMTRFTDQDIADRELERLSQMEVADMSDLEYEYFKFKSREKPGRVAINFQELYSSDRQHDIKLKSGDVIRIPTVSEVITVSGEVANPGLQAYNPEFNYSDYIKLAGGYSFRADKGKVRIIKAVTGEWKKAKKNAVLKPGDTVLIPEEKKIEYLKTIRDVIAFTANVATVYLVIKQATE